MIWQGLWTTNGDEAPGFIPVFVFLGALKEFCG